MRASTESSPPRPEGAQGARPGPRRWLALGLVALLYFAVPNARPDFSRFNCQDSESYLALSRSLVEGRGYTRSLIPGRYVPHVLWPPGMPLLLAPAAALSGERIDWLAVKWTVAAVGLVGVALAWLLARRLSGRRRIADLAALALALNPFYWDFSHQAMAEVPTLVWMLAGLLLVDLLWFKREVGWGAALAAGLFCGVGMLFKGLAAALAAAPLAYALESSPGRRKRGLAVCAIFALGVALPFLGWTLRNSAVDATGFDGIRHAGLMLTADPEDPESPRLGPGAALARVVGQLRTHGIYRLPAQVIPGLWPERAFAWRGSGVPALALSALLLGLALSRRPGEVALLATATAVAAINLAYGFGGSPRFWVPVSMLVTLLLCVRLGRRLTRAAPRTRAVAATALVAVLAVNLAAYVVLHERRPFNPNGPWAELAALFERAADLDLEPVGVLAPNPHAFQLVTGWPAPMPAAGGPVDHMVARVDGRGPQPPAGARPVLEVRPWALFELPRAEEAGDLLGDARWATRWEAGER